MKRISIRLLLGVVKKVFHALSLSCLSSQRVSRVMHESILPLKLKLSYNSNSLTGAISIGYQRCKAPIKNDIQRQFLQAVARDCN